MILSERLSRIASYVPGELVVADIGTDHALLPIYLVLQEIASHVIACDISSGPLESARANIYLYKLTEKIEIRQGDGLEPLNRGEADVIIISGMGGAKIRDILETSPDVLDEVVRIILQPQRGAGIVRRWLFAHNWEVIDEDLVLENDNYYEIIIAEHTMNVGVFAIDKNLGRQEEELLDVGPRLVEKKHPLLIPFLQEKIKLAENVLKSLRQAKTPAGKIMCQEWRRKILLYRRTIENVTEMSTDI
jgi:tRNA (adenine22-N1)-methyltransferase